MNALGATEQKTAGKVETSCSSLVSQLFQSNIFCEHACQFHADTMSCIILPTCHYRPLSIRAPVAYFDYVKQMYCAILRQQKHTPLMSQQLLNLLCSHTHDKEALCVKINMLKFTIPYGDRLSQEFSLVIKEGASN